ncbi:MAG: adenine deaminase [Bacteroidetes bacterium]|nr:MAG: adenine deaminase [Bacteroidota bacterium]
MLESISSVQGLLVDIFSKKIIPGILHLADGKISGFTEKAGVNGPYILPGFVDAHIHIESSMLVPYEFARIALTHGTVATVSDPHEIANVNGIAGVEYMLENAIGAKLKFCFGAPSCVPATAFESAGDALDSDAVNSLLQRQDIYYLSEMMNYPGVLHKDPEVIKKIELAKKYNLPVDGHAPGLRGIDAKNYIDAGISTDHECFTLDEALEKVAYGMKILIREGSAARNFDALHSLLSSHPEMCMLCCDDKHPDELLLGHIDQHVKRAVALGHNVFDVLKAACVNPVLHYKLPVGLLRMGDPADFILVNDLKDFKVLSTFIDGERVYHDGHCTLPERKHKAINKFKTDKKKALEFEVEAKSKKIRVIEALDGQLITSELHIEARVQNGKVASDPARDILKIAVVNRYDNAKPAVAFIKNFGLKSGAIASTVAHDSHNIIVVGVDDDSICRAVNLLIQEEGGLSVVNAEDTKVLPLPIAGLMSAKTCVEVGTMYSELDSLTKKMGSKLRAPYMTLSFMALLVIPQLKLSDKGLFDGSTFSFANLFIED